MGPLDHFSTNKRSTRKEHDAGCFLAVVDILQYQHIKECDYSTNIGIQYLYVRWAFCNIWESLPFSAESGRFVASSSAAETTRYRLQLIKWLWHCSFPYLAGYCPACASLHSTQFPSLWLFPAASLNDIFSNVKAQFSVKHWQFLVENYHFPHTRFGMSVFESSWCVPGVAFPQDLSIYPDITGVRPGMTRGHMRSKSTWHQIFMWVSLHQDPEEQWIRSDSKHVFICFCFFPYFESHESHVKRAWHCSFHVQSPLSIACKDRHGFHCSWYDVHPVGFSGVLGGSLLYITGRTFDVDLSKTLAAGPNTNLQEFVDLCSTAANAQFWGVIYLRTLSKRLPHKIW